jgi:hypothetical protein
MILGKHIDIIADGQHIAGTITETAVGYCVVTDALGKQYHVRGYDIPPTHRAWAHPEYPFRAVDAYGDIYYFSEPPYMTDENNYESWAVDNAVCLPAGRYEDFPWLRANWSKSLQHRDEL